MYRSHPHQVAFWEQAKTSGIQNQQSLRPHFKPIMLITAKMLFSFEQNTILSNWHLLMKPIGNAFKLISNERKHRDCTYCSMDSTLSIFFASKNEKTRQSRV